MPISTPRDGIPGCRRATALALAAAAVLAGLSLAIPFTPVYDAWAWLTWGRELGGLELDTSAGPSWKPLPVAISFLLAPFGDGAPELWLWFSRTCWLISPILAWGLASRLVREPGRAPAIGAGLIAALAVVFINDPVTAWTRQFAGGMSEPVAVALLLAAIDRHLAARPGQALAATTAVALVRPESWPIFVAYAVFMWIRDPRLRPGVAAAAALIPLAWFLPDLLGSGDALSGAGRARVGAESPIAHAAEAIRRSAALPLAALWVGALWTGVSSLKRGERDLQALTLGALAWILAVAALSVVGYAGLPRFSAPAAAVISVLGAVGVARLATASMHGHTAVHATRLAAVLLALAIGAQSVLRAAEVPGEVRHAVDLGRQGDELRSVTEEVAGNTRCGHVVLTDFLAQTAVAWQLNLAIADVGYERQALVRDSFVIVGPSAPRTFDLAVNRFGDPVARDGDWSVYAVSCEGRASSESGRLNAGVTGARR